MPVLNNTWDQPNLLLFWKFHLTFGFSRFQRRIFLVLKFGTVVCGAKVRLDWIEFFKLSFDIKINARVDFICVQCLINEIISIILCKMRYNLLKRCRLLIKQVKVKLTCINCHIRTALFWVFVYNGDRGGHLFFNRQRYASKTSLRAVVIATVAFLAHTFCKVLFIRVFTVYDFFLSFIIVEIASPTHALRKRWLLLMRAHLV